MSLFSVCLLGGSCQRPKRILKCSLVAGQSQKRPRVFSQSLYEKNSWIVFEVIWWLDCNMWKKGLWVYEICVLGLQSYLKYWSPNPSGGCALEGWTVRPECQGSFSCVLFVLMFLLMAHCSCSINSSCTELKGMEIFFFFEVLGGGLWESYANAIICGLHIVIFGLHEKMDCHGQAFCWLDLRACCVLRLSTDSSDPVPCVRTGDTETKGLAPFWVEHWSTQPAFIECLLYGGQWEPRKQ